MTFEDGTSTFCLTMVMSVNIPRIASGPAKGAIASV